MSTRVITRFQRQQPSTTNGSKPATATVPRRRRLRHIAALGATGVVIALLAFIYDPRNLFEESVTDDGSTLRDTAAVTLSSLSEDYGVDGTVVFHNAISLSFRTGPVEGSGVGPGASAAPTDATTVTEMVAAGTAVAHGDVLWRVGLEPTVVLVGPNPAYRTLSRDTEGPDVEQLEASLAELGFDPDGTVTIDQSFTANTEAMVKRWQDDIGAEITGAVSPSNIIYIAGPGRVGAITAAVGDSVHDGSAMLEFTALQREITFTVPASDRETLVVGDSVEARLPDRSTVSATIAEMTINDAGGAVVSAFPDEPIESSVDVVPVTVSWAVSLGDDLLTVPAGAIVRTDSGTFYVEVRNADDTEQYVAVTVGASSGGRVEISGDISVGDIVITP